MDQHIIDDFLNRDDIRNSHGEIYGGYLQELFKDNQDLWRDLLSSWAKDTNLWIYDGDLRELAELVNSSGGRFTEPEVALELGNLYIKEAPLVKWLKAMMGADWITGTENICDCFGAQKSSWIKSIRPLFKNAGFEIRYNSSNEPLVRRKDTDYLVLNSGFKPRKQTE